MGICKFGTSEHGTAILIILEGRETAFNGFKYQFTTGKPSKNLKLNLQLLWE
jgi:hypothetical protein